MARLVREALVASPLPRHVASLIARGVYAATPRDFVEGVRAYIVRNVTLVDEYDELLVDPLCMLAAIEGEGSRAGDCFLGPVIGDCDDTAMLAALLVAAYGIPARFKAIERDPGSGSMRHVFTEYRLGNSWYPLDTTIRVAPIYGPDVLIEEV
jgi:transglutaminase-like putative cysteine protease